MADLPKPIPWPRPVPTDWPAPQRQTSGETWGLSQLLTQALVQPLDAPRSPGAVSGWGMSLFQAGWPCRCVEAQVAEVKRRDVPVRTDFRPAVKLPETLHFLRVREARYRVLPLRPIWPGFAINTIFYAALLWMLWLSPFVVRRVVRRRRGRCINCGYDLRGTSGGGGEVCPECGAQSAQGPAMTSPALHGIGWRPDLPRSRPGSSQSLRSGFLPSMPRCLDPSMPSSTQFRL